MGDMLWGSRLGRDSGIIKEMQFGLGLDALQAMGRVIGT